MSQDRTRKIVIAGVMAAVSILLGITRWGFIPWFAGVSLTIMHVPVIIGAILEGPIVGLVIGVIFGLFSMIQAAVAPNGPGDVIFTNPLISILPRLFIGPLAWLVWNTLKRWKVFGLIAAGLAGSLTNSVFVLGMIGLLALYPWQVIGVVFITNSLPEMAVSALIVLIVIAAWWRIRVGKKEGSDL